MPDLNFTTRNTIYATHGLHAYAAKCPPPLVKYGLRYYSKRGETILDPMVGSGTTIVEARLMGRNAIGYDIDPLAQLIAQVKSRIIRDDYIENAYELIKGKAERDLIALRSQTVTSALRQRATPPEFPNRDYWFSQEVLEALAILSYHISNISIPESVRDFFWVAFSSLILAKTSVANARDIIHSRHHYWQHSQVPDVLAKFDARMRIMRKQMSDFRERCLKATKTTSETRVGDARQLKVRSESIDLVFTSPPYATALDYPRAHFLAIAWMQKVLGLSLEEYRKHAPTYIGSERGCLIKEFTIDKRLVRLDLTQSVVMQLAEESVRQAKHVQRYFVDMHKVFGKIERVLKHSRHAIIVVCPSHIRKIEVPTHKALAEIGRVHGLRLKNSYSRTIALGKRILPYMQESFGKRMDTEYVLVFQKVS